MRKKFHIYLVMFILCLTAGTVLGTGKAAASDPAGEAQEQPAVPETEAGKDTGKKSGWVTYQNGVTKYFDENGNYVTGFKRIDGKVYSFAAGGSLQKDKWISRNGSKYRTDENGVLIQGRLAKINGKVYCFRQNGAMRTGWGKIDGEKAYFRANGVMAVGLTKINGKYYYFGAGGKLQKDKWIKYNGKTYYLKKNGAAYTGWKEENGKKMYFRSGGAMAVGLTKISGKYYYFGADGTMKTGEVEADGVTYYLADDGVLEARKEEDTYYDSKNKKMTAVQVSDFETLQRAKKIVAEITTPSMSQSQKLRKCFDWVMAKTYLTRRKFTNAPGWIALYANDHFIYGSGNCQSDAAAFGYLAKALGYTEVYMCVDSKGSGHSWTEINGLVYDPLFAQAKSFSQNYGVRYGVYKLRAIQHVKI